MAQQHEHAVEERPGHHWKEPERVQEFVSRMDRRAAERAEQLMLLVRLIPFPADAELQVLDIGAGYGAIASAVLDAFPRAQAVLLDLSDEMMRVGAERMAPFAGRYRYLQGDFADGALPESVDGPFHAIVSGLAIHHLPPAGKQSLYRDIAGRLLPGGCFLNLDHTGAPDEGVAAVYRQVEARGREARGEQPPSPRHVREHHSEFQPVELHLAWLREAGLQNVDCYWKRLGTALFGGFKPGT